jgi:hypothetical protein
LEAEGKVHSSLGKKGEIKFFENDPVFGQITLNPVPPTESKVHVSVITTGLVADIWVRDFFAVSRE